MKSDLFDKKIGVELKIYPVLQKMNNHSDQSDHVKNMDSSVFSTTDTLHSQSLFQNHLLSAKNQTPKIHQTKYDYWDAGILLLSFILFVWIYVTNRKRLNQIVKGFYINRYANQLSREEFSLTNRVSIFLWILFILTLTLFISESLIYFNFPLPSTNIFFSYLIITAVIVSMYVIKIGSVKFFGSVFQIRKEAADYILILFLYGNTLGLFLLPVVICIAFFKQISTLHFIYLGSGIIVIFLITRIVRGLIIGFNNLQFSKFYLFLYLCTLEILPFVIIIKLFLLKMK